MAENDRLEAGIARRSSRDRTEVAELNATPRAMPASK
jgi:hypothetical protein